MERAAGTVSPVIRAGDEVVDYLRKAKAARLHKHRRVRFFVPICTLAVVSANSSAKC